MVHSTAHRHATIHHAGSSRTWGRIALAAVGTLWEQSQQQIQRWGQALLDGGTAAQQAKSQTETLAASWGALNNMAVLGGPG